MYRIPLDLDLSGTCGQFTTQLHIGPFDVQFTFGTVSFLVQSAIKLFRDDVELAAWESGEWPPAAFRDLMNVVVVSA